MLLGEVVITGFSASNLQRCEGVCLQGPSMGCPLPSPTPEPPALQILAWSQSRAAAPPLAHLGWLQALPAMSSGPQEPFSLLEGNTTVCIFSQSSHHACFKRAKLTKLLRLPVCTGPGSAQVLSTQGTAASQN